VAPAGARKHRFDGLGAGIPERSLSCVLTSPRAASSPKTNPAIAMAMTISGPSENTE
jgi:hypothetical protein